MVFLSRWLVRLFRPLQLQRLLLAHNLVCSVWSLYCFAMFVVGLASYGFPECLMVMQRGNEVVLHALRAYWLSKLFELLDTVYMVLRHKLRQVSFLHVWHHASITLLADYAYHLLPFPAFTVILMMNSFIHVIMYSYYGLTALYPLQQFSWKRRITQLQMVQFALAMVHGVYGYLYHGFCVYSVLYGVTMMTLFGNFYRHAFMRSQKLGRTVAGDKSD